MAQGAGDADSCQLTLLVDRAPHPDHRIKAQELDGDRGVAEIHLTTSKRIDDGSRQRLYIDLQPDRQSGCRSDRWNRFVHPQHIRPELLVSEGVVSEDILAFAMAINPAVMISTMSAFARPQIGR